MDDWQIAPPIACNIFMIKILSEQMAVDGYALPLRDVKEFYFVHITNCAFCVFCAYTFRYTRRTATAHML